ncbi:MAG TPA: YciI family protein [Solirubrobacteraceae bacterium]
MLLLYATEEEEFADHGAEWPIWSELNRSLQEAGLLAATGRLHPTTTATTVSAISGETELTDGPFAITKEVLVGYYLIESENLDQALNVAKRIPLIRYGRVEVRPVMDPPVE